MDPSVVPQFFFILLLLLLPHRTHATNGKWELLNSNIGISAMHMQLLNSDRVIIYDRTDFGASNISLPNGKCRHDPYEQALKVDCTAHSVEFDVTSRSVRPLMVLTDVWCSSGAVMPDGTLAQAGGSHDGEFAARIFKPCANNTCDWQEINPALDRSRWYSTSHILPDGREIIVGGRQQFNFEFYPKIPAADKSYDLPFLSQTNDNGIENNLYPFVFLNVDGNLFIFANNRAILFDYVKRVVVKDYPVIPGGDPRNYPSTGSAVLLPLKSDSGPEVFLCGGAPKGSYASAVNRSFVTALNTCGRIRINDPKPQWVMETMPGPRVMGDMILLPNGEVLIINGATSGTAGWNLGQGPVLSPVTYRPNNPVESRFKVESPTSTPRMYHSSAILLRDGRVLVGGSNPQEFYNFTGVQFPTDLTLEAFSPYYLDSESRNMRPRITSPITHSKIGYKLQLLVQFTIRSPRVDIKSILVTMVAPSFTTHSFSMSQRLLILDGGNVTTVEKSHQILVTTPNSVNLAPPGYYLLFVVHKNIPSEGIWVQLV